MNRHFREQVRLFSIVLLMCAWSCPARAALSLDEIIVSMQRLSQDATRYSAMIDGAFEALQSRPEDMQRLLDEINVEAESIARRSKAIVKHVTAYQDARLSEEDRAKMQTIAELLQTTEAVFNPAQKRLGQLTRLTFKKNIQGVLKSLAGELAKSYQQNQAYPDRLDQLQELLRDQPYRMSYKKLDARHFKVIVEPLPDALAQGMVPAQKFVLNESGKIQILTLSDGLVETVDLKM